VVSADREGDGPRAHDGGDLVLDDVASERRSEGGNGDVAAVGGAEGAEDVALWVG
jgi:hypothetical protein